MILILFIILLVILFLINQKNEEFVSNLSMIDPSPVYYYRIVSDKELWWNLSHSKKLFYYRDMSPPVY